MHPGKIPRCGACSWWLRSRLWPARSPTSSATATAPAEKVGRSAGFFGFRKNLNNFRNNFHVSMRGYALPCPRNKFKYSPCSLVYSLKPLYAAVFAIFIPLALSISYKFPGIFVLIKLFYIHTHVAMNKTDILIQPCNLFFSAINGACSVHEWTGNFRQEQVTFKMTSVCGHVMSLDFISKYNNWDRVDPVCKNICQNSFVYLLYGHLNYNCLFIFFNCRLSSLHAQQKKKKPLPNCA